MRHKHTYCLSEAEEADRGYKGQTQVRQRKDAAWKGKSVQFSTFRCNSQRSAHSTAFSVNIEVRTLLPSLFSWKENAVLAVTKQKKKNPLGLSTENKTEVIL